MRIRLLSVGVLLALSLSTLPSASAAKDPVVPTSWANLEKNYKGIAFGAWKKSNAKIMKSQATAVKIVEIIGPNSKRLNNKAQTGISLASRLYAGFPVAKEINIVYFTIDDVQWAQEKLDSLTNNDPNVRNEAKNSCQKVRECWGASARTLDTERSVLMIAVEKNGVLDPNHSSGSLEAHEFTHTMQDIGFIGTRRSWGSVPRWLVEGHAEFSQAAAVYNSTYKSYLTERQRNTGELFRSKMYTSAWLAKFIDPEGWTDWRPWDQYEGWRLYDVGSLVTEALVSLKGPDSTLQLFQEAAIGGDFAAAFEKVYGIAWKDAVPILSRTIAKEIKG